MNANQISTIVFILSMVVGVSGYILGIIPPQYVALATVVFGLISEIVNYLKSGYANRPVEVEGA